MGLVAARGHAPLPGRQPNFGRIRAALTFRQYGCVEIRASRPTLRGHDMWNITSNSVQRAKEQLQLRRAEIETRYAEENKALDAEAAVIETLERAASEFMLRHRRENGAPGLADPIDEHEEDNNDARVDEEPQPAAPLDGPSGGELGASLGGSASQPGGEFDPTGGESKGGLDFLKPGSRWRLYRGSQPTESEGLVSDTPRTMGE